ncbi:hypothetical protein [Enterobacter phage vB_ExiM_F5M1E]|nr:hypothetical protein [Enterobacter phage vB_ExiM_F1M1E]UNA03091.1 hypothetical protein [Enterobacter phage vB_ExiM_F2M1E]UNA03412.1 hypothetical protein [Enterobacter phage vB_ExiM_F4M1E]UNA03733.1 hypothetical protein [Enterobacter phage vB_ExiM_F5M1E]UNA04053.1 hypothetical protein [Pantoea phage vB_PdiM_F5M2A]
MNPHKLLITAYPNKADRRETLDRLTLYYQEAGHSKATARALAKKRLRFGKN